MSDLNLDQILKIIVFVLQIIIGIFVTPTQKNAPINKSPAIPRTHEQAKPSVDLSEYKCEIQVIDTIEVNGTFVGADKCVYVWRGKGSEYCKSGRIPKEHQGYFPPMFRIKDKSVIQNVALKCAVTGIDVVGSGSKLDKIIMPQCGRECVLIRGNDTEITRSFFQVANDTAIRILPDAEETDINNSTMWHCSNCVKHYGTRLTLEQNQFYNFILGSIAINPFSHILSENNVFARGHCALVTGNGRIEKGKNDYFSYTKKECLQRDVRKRKTRNNNRPHKS